MKNSNFKCILILCSVFPCLSIDAQTTYIGAGNDQNIVVTAGHSQGMSTPYKTINGSGLDSKLFGASRFLNQATLGSDLEEIDRVLEMGYGPWLDDQFSKPPTVLLPVLNTIWSQIKGLNPEAFGPWAVHFNYAWWQTNMTNQDLLRQKIAYALSQVLVVSINSDIRDWGDAMSSYYDIFINHAFGNYRTILGEVAKHPVMGFYLGHFNNHPTDTLRNIKPDENFAREIMQLFTIGLVQLNPDGTPQTNSQGQQVPTYNNDDIRQLAKVFTGMGPGGVLSMMYCPNSPDFNVSMWCTNKIVPMQMYGRWHEKGPKTFMGFSLPGSNTYTNQSAMAEVDATLDFLFNHPNTAPFVSYRLIQRLVKSNPSPQYVSRVSAVFNNNGFGVRGDMKAIIKAILLDVEAQDFNSQDPQGIEGKLREPFLRYSHLARALPTAAHRSRYWNNGFNYLNATKQHVLAAPTVFNFYPTDFKPQGDFISLNKVAPELKLHNTATSVGYFNEAFSWTFWNSLMYSWEGRENNPDGAWLILSELEAIADDHEALINRLDKILTHGQLTDGTRQILRDAIKPLFWNGNQEWRIHRVRLALYLLMVSPDYAFTR